MIWASVGSVQFSVISSAQAVAPHSMCPIFLPNLEEARREALDIGKLLTIILLDVVVHKHLLKKLYHLGIQDKHWTLIKSLHTNASSAIKFKG
jgi:hypothetical protein